MLTGFPSFSFFKQLAIIGSSPGVRAGHAAINIGTKVSHKTKVV